ncbi:hypothetical protein [Methanobrevibacter sp.]
MVQPKDASFKFISKEHLQLLFAILDVNFGMELDFSDVEVLTSEEVAIEPSLIRPDYIVKIENVIFMLEFESSHVGTKKKKLFKLYISAYDFKNNDEDNQIVFFVVSTKEKSKMASYSINNWDTFNFPILSLADLNKEEIINNISYKIENEKEFHDKELLEFSLTPILGDSKEEIIQQFEKTGEMLTSINFPSDKIKRSVYGILLMLSSIYFDELDSIRKKIQGDMMGKVDCVTEACNESYDRGIKQGIEQGIEQGKDDAKVDIACNMICGDVCSLEEISNITGLSLSKIKELKRNL